MKAARTPGQLIKAFLHSRGWTQRVLAIVLGVDQAIVNKLVADKKPVDAKMAIALSEVFGVRAEKFMDLQKSYELALARIVSQPDPGRRTRAYLFGDLPVSEMIKRGWLEAQDVRDLPAVEKALAKFFGETTVAEIEILPHSAKKTNVFAPVTAAQLAWIYRVKQIASDMLVARYSRESARKAAERLRPLRSTVDQVRHVPRV